MSEQPRTSPYRPRAAAVLVAAVLAAAGCADGSNGGGGDSLTYALGDEPEQINPVLVDEHLDPVTEMVFRGLTAHSADNTIVPALAKSWEISEDGRTYTFALREDVTWHDGAKFGADDVVFTVREVRDSTLPTSNKFAAVEKVSAPDDGTVVIELAEPAPALLDSLSNGILPEHLLAGKGIDDPEFGRNPVGTGPFTLEEWDHRKHAELSAFADYYEGPPGLDEVTVVYIPDAATRLIRLRNGEIDAASLEPRQAAEFAEDGDTRLAVYPTADYRGVLFNMAHGVFDDPAPRRAMNYAIDRGAIVDTVLHGYGSPASGPLDRSPFHADSAGYGFDPGQVESIMADAGYRRNGDGIWADGDGPVEFRLTTFAEDGLRAAMIEVLATQLRDQGFDVTAEPTPRDAVDWEEVQAFLIGWGTPYDPDGSLYGPFHSSEALDNGGSNYGSYANKAVDDALDRGRATGDETERRAAYTDLQRALIDDPPYIWVSYLQAVNAVPAGLKGPRERTLAHHGYGFFWNVQDWTYAN